MDVRFLDRAKFPHSGGEAPRVDVEGLANPGRVGAILGPDGRRISGTTGLARKFTAPMA